jgi:hypothetical protein
MSKRNVKKGRNSAVMNFKAKRRRIIVWVIVAVAVGLIAYGAWLGQNISAR